MYFVELTQSSTLTVILNGPDDGTDFDLYLRRGQQPSTSVYDVRGYTESADEVVRYEDATPGTYYVMVRAYRSSGEYTVTATLGANEDVPLVLDPERSGTMTQPGHERMYFVELTQTSTLTVILNGPDDGTDFDLYLRRGEQPTTSVYDVRGYTESADEVVRYEDATPGTYYVMVRAYRGIGTYTVTARKMVVSQVPPPPSFDGSTEEYGRVYGIFIGINKYIRGNNVRFCVASATHMRDALSPGWEAPVIKFLTDRSATRTNVFNALSSVASQATADDLVVFYYAGHGSTNGLNQYLVTHDGLRIYDRRLKSFLDRIPKPEDGRANVLVILDSCYSGGIIGRSQVPVARKTIATVPLLALPISRESRSTFTRQLSRPGYTVLAAGHGSETVWETGRLGAAVFTYYLLKGLGLGQGIGLADTDADQQISAEEAFRYAAPRTYNYTYTNMPDRDVTSDQRAIIPLARAEAGAQHPQFYDSDTQREMEIKKRPGYTWRLP